MIFIKIFSSKKPVCFLGQCVTVVEWVIQSGRRVLFCRLGIWSGLNLLSQEPQLVWKGIITHTNLAPPVPDAAEACLVVETLICPLSLKVVLVTDGCLGIGRGSLRHSLATHNQRSESNRFPLPFPFPSKLYVMCMANLEEVMSLTHTFFFLHWIIIVLL